MATIPTTSWQIDGGKVEIVTDCIFLGSKITADGDCILWSGNQSASLVGTSFLVIFPLPRGFWPGWVVYRNKIFKSVLVISISYLKWNQVHVDENIKNKHTCKLFIIKVISKLTQMKSINSTFKNWRQL